MISRNRYPTASNVAPQGDAGERGWAGRTIAATQTASRSRGRVRAAAAVLFGLAMAGCTDAAGYDLDYLLGRTPVLSTMRTTAAFESHTMPRLPAPGAVPVAAPNGVDVPPFTQAQLDSVAAVLTNPLPATEEVIARGARVYEIQCFTCHGAEGAGNGPVVGGGRFPLGPTLVDATASGRTDGYIYGVIRVGRGLMPAYGDRISDSDRWALVHYLRRLQGS